MTAPVLTPRQAEVLAIIEAHPKGLTAAWVADRIYPPDSSLRTKRSRGKGASNHTGAIGVGGNLHAGRILAALERKHLIHSGDERFGESRSRFYPGVA